MIREKGISPNQYQMIVRGSSKSKTLVSMLQHSLLIQSKEGNCDYTKNSKPCYIKYNNQDKFLVITKNKHAYLTYTTDSFSYEDKPYIWNIIDPKHYTFDRFLRGHDF